jgi:HEAT repeat protein
MSRFLSAALLVLAVAGVAAKAEAPVSALNTLNRKLSDPDPRVRLEAVKTLGKMGTEMQQIANVLAIKLQDNDVTIRIAAAEALGDIGPSAYLATPQLVKALQDKNTDVRRQAAYALGQIGSKAKGAVPALTKALTDDNLVVRQRAAAALGMIGPEAKSAVPALVRLMQSPQEGVPVEDSGQLDAVIAIGDIGPAAKDAIPALMTSIKVGEQHMRLLALRSLAKVAPHDQALMTLLKTWLKGNSLPMRRAAVGALGELGPDAKQAVPDLIEAAGAKDIPNAKDARSLRLAIISALRSIAPASREAENALHHLAADSDPIVQASARHALREARKKN